MSINIMQLYTSIWKWRFVCNLKNWLQIQNTFCTCIYKLCFACWTFINYPSWSDYSMYWKSRYHDASARRVPSRHESASRIKLYQHSIMTVNGKSCDFTCVTRDWGGDRMPVTIDQLYVTVARIFNKHNSRSRNLTRKNLVHVTSTETATTTTITQLKQIFHRRDKITHLVVRNT